MSYPYATRLLFAFKAWKIIYLEGDLNCDLNYPVVGLHNMRLTPHELILGHRLRLPTTVAYKAKIGFSHSGL